MSKSKFTIITPNYNMAYLLPETIESVLKNLKPDDEYFVIDGGSSDGSVDIIKSYADRLTGWVSESDTGYAEAISKGFSRGTGEYQCWVNSGDVLLEGSLNLARELLDEYDADMIFGDDLHFDENGRVIGYSRGICSNLKNAMLYGDWTPLQDACFWRSSLYWRVGGLDQTLKNAADYALFLQFAINGKTCYAPYAFSAFRRHEGQKSIANRVSYKAEKSIVRQKMVAESKDSALMKLVQRWISFVAMRWRARVMHRLWDIPSLHGRPVGELSAGIAWPSGERARVPNPQI